MSNTLTLDPKKWTYRDYAAFLQALQGQNFEGALVLVMKALVAWTYDIPIGPEAYRRLPFPALKEVVAGVSETIAAYVGGLDHSLVHADMSRWDMQDFFEFREAGRAGNVPEMERLMRKVCSIPGVSDLEPLTFEQGSLMSAAIAAATSEMFSQGN